MCQRARPVLGGSPLWCHNDVIIYLALGYEVLRKRKYDHMTHSTLSACLFLATASYLVIVYASRSLHYVTMLASSSIFICHVSLRHIYFYHTSSPSAESAYVIPIFTRLHRHLKHYKKATQDSFHSFISRTATTTLLHNGKQQRRRTS